MIIQYKIPFQRNRKIARYYCKSSQFLKKKFIKRRLLLHLDSEVIDYREIPVIINNYNRLTHLQLLISWLEKAEMRNIYIIDNASTYPELLDYYTKTNHVVFQLQANIGYKALWDTQIHLWFKGLPYLYTDSDVLPIEECPLDVVRFFLEVLNKYPEYNKVGLGLKIDDIPDYYPNKKHVIDWESKYWNNPISDILFKADIDTTFALYKAYSVNQQWNKTLRTGSIYLARHLPWYENPEFISDEEKFFRKKTIGSSWYSANNF